MSKSSKLVFFGTEDFSATCLKALIDAGFNIVAVVTKPDAPSGRGRQIKSPLVKEVAAAHNITVFQPHKLTDIKAGLASLDASFGVLVSYGKIVPPEILEIFPGGVINLHPSLLPKYRGPSPIEASILNGDKVAGISLMQLSPGMDEGPVYCQMSLDISHTKPNRIELSLQIAKEGAAFLVKNLPNILSGELKPKAQLDSDATYTKLFNKADGVIDWQEPAELIERKIRAYLGYPKSRAKIHGQDVIITKAKVVEALGEDRLILPTGKGNLEVIELIGPSGRTMSGTDFIRGYKK